jgi:hypothetical protein
MTKSLALLDRKGELYKYLPPEQRDLVADCEKLIEDAHKHPQNLTDYSYIVFPIAKMYEGFLKKLFLDLNLIGKDQYYSEHFRIGKALNPNLEAHLRLESVYDKLCHHFDGEVIAKALWEAWKKGRNLLFHYFPGNLSRISLSEAEFTVRFVLEVSTQAVAHNERKT